MGASLVLLGVAGCSDPAAPEDAAVDDAAVIVDAFRAPPDAALPPPTEEPFKGPWVVRPSTDGSTVRWETRLPLTPPEVIVTREDGSGEPLTFSGSSTETEVRLSYGIGVRAIEIPDVPGTYFVNEVAVTGLDPATCYRYSIGGFPEHGGRFCTTHLPTDVETPITFYAIGDTSPVFMGTLRVMDVLPPSETELSVHVGDLQYYSTVLETQQYWFETMRPLLEANAFMPCFGNHEHEIDYEQEDIYERLFGTPGDAPDPTYWFHYATGGVHFLSLSTEHDLSEGSEQRAWLDATLARIEAEPTFRFVVLYMHRPIYSVGDYEISRDLRAQMEPVIRDHRIPLVLAGHMHGYERFTVPYADATPHDTAYVTTGGGGFRISPDAISQYAATFPEDAALRVAYGNFIQAMRFTVTRDGEEDVVEGFCSDDSGVPQDGFQVRCIRGSDSLPVCSVD